MMSKRSSGAELPMLICVGDGADVGFDRLGGTPAARAER
jgi:hypothetical protein